MRKVLGTLTFFLLAACWCTFAQSPMGSQTIDAAQRKQAVDDLCKLMKENYVFPDVAARTAEFIQKQLASGAYDRDTAAVAFCDDLTRDLRSISKDKHMRVGVRPPGENPVADDSPEARERMRQQMRQENFGFEKAEILPGNIGYLDLRMFLTPLIAGETAVAAMNFLGNCDALIFDLRQNGGGEPAMIQLLSTYLFAESTHLNDLYFRKGEKRDQFWTLPYAPGPKLVDVPVYVLTSSYTFSGAEEFANNLKVLKRATLIGETTGGGANPGEGFPVAPFFQCFIPTGRAINPTTGTNWEGTGVEPDIKVPARDALRVARTEALKALRAKTKSPEESATYSWLLEGVDAQAHPATFTAKELEAFAGTYGPRRVWVEEGRLRVQREGRPAFFLVPMTGTTFTLEGSDDVRFAFQRGPGQRVTGVAISYSDGRKDEAPRTEGPSR
jgi:retinol-binding protein 3